MKKNLFKLLFSAFLITSFVSCNLDNYSGPNAQIEGCILDIETGELVETDVIDGTTIKLLEHGYDPVTAQYLRVKNDGTYANKMLFANTYTVQPDQRNFVQIEAQDVEIGKNTKLDFSVLPYIRIKNLEIKQVKNNITATFNIEQTTNDPVAEIALYAFEEPTVGNAIYQVVEKKPLNRIVEGNETFELVMNVGKNTAYFKEGKSYFFRVGVRSSASGIKYNYASAVRLELGEIVPDLEPEGTYLDRCEITDGWSGNGGPILDSDNPQEGEHSVKFHSDKDGFIISKSYAPFDPEVNMEQGILQFSFYISDVSVYNWSSPGQIEISSSGKPDNQELHWNFTDELHLANGWNKLVLKLSEAGAEGGAINLHGITFFRIYHLDSNGPSDLKIDNIKFYNEEN